MNSISKIGTILRAFEKEAEYLKDDGERERRLILALDIAVNRIMESPPLHVIDAADDNVALGKILSALEGEKVET